MVEADLLDEDSLFKAMEGADYVVHTASPFMIGKVDHEDVFIKPAVEGTLSVLRAAVKDKVKRVVITSSVAAIYEVDEFPEVFNESFWSNTERKDPPIAPYTKSKTLAEKAAWDFQKSLPEEERFELVTINPSLILGPPYVDGGFASGEVLSKILLGEYPGMPKVKMGIVDVRECAQAHLNAVKIDEAKNQRFILCNRTVWMSEFATWLHDEFRPQGYKFNPSEMKYCMLKVASWFKPEAKHMVNSWAKDYTFDNTKSKNILKVDYSEDLPKCINEMAYNMIESGQIVDKRPKAKK